MSAPLLNSTNEVLSSGGRRTLWLILFAGFLLRLGFGLTLDPHTALRTAGDGMEYLAHARAIIDGRGDHPPRTSIFQRPPLYAWFLVPFEGLTPQEGREFTPGGEFDPPVTISRGMFVAIQTAQHLLGMATAWILGIIAGRWAGPRAQLWATTLCCFNPFLIYWSAFVMTETLFIFLTWWGVFSLQNYGLRRGMAAVAQLALAGLVITAACFCRPVLQLLLPPAALWVGWIAWRRGNAGTALRDMALLTAITSIFMLPPMTRHWRTSGEFTLSPGYAGASFGFGNNPNYLAMLRARTWEDFYRNFERAMGPVLSGAGNTPEQVAEIGRKFRREQPAEFRQLLLAKTIAYWRPWVNPVIYSPTRVAVSALITVPLWVLGIWGLCSRRWQNPLRPLLWALLVVGYVTGGLIWVVSLRYRLPFAEPVFMLATAAVLGTLPVTARWLRWAAIPAPPTISAANLQR